MLWLRPCCAACWSGRSAPDWQTRSTSNASAAWCRACERWEAAPYACRGCAGRCCVADAGRHSLWLANRASALEWMDAGIAWAQTVTMQAGLALQAVGCPAVQGRRIGLLGQCQSSSPREQLNHQFMRPLTFP